MSAHYAIEPTPPPAHDWTPPAGFPCKIHAHRIDSHSDRIDKLERKADTADSRFGQGDVAFAEIRKDIHVLTAAVTSMTGTIRWVGGIVITAVLVAVLNQVVHAQALVAAVKP